MIRTYTNTTMHPVLSDAEIEIHAYDRCKYEGPVESVTDTYKGLESFSIIDGQDGEEFEQANFQPEDYDDYHEYLVLNFVSGYKIAFRNSYVDMFVY